MSNDNTVRKDIGEDLGYTAIWEIGIVFALACIIACVYLYGLFLRVDQAEKDRKQINAIDMGMVETIQNQINEINEFGWSSAEDGLVSIPIEQAMKTTADQLAVERYEDARESALSEAEVVDETDDAAEDENEIALTETEGSEH